MRIPFETFDYDTQTHQWFDRNGRMVTEQEVMEWTYCSCGCRWTKCSNCGTFYCPACQPHVVGENPNLYWACHLYQQ